MESLLGRGWVWRIALLHHLCCSWPTFLFFGITLLVFLSAVMEPTWVECEPFKSLENMLKWVGFPAQTGDVEHLLTARGSFLKLLDMEANEPLRFSRQHQGGGVRALAREVHTRQSPVGLHAQQKDLSGNGAEHVHGIWWMTHGRAESA